MTAPELAHLQMLAQVDALIDRLGQWAAADSPWQPMQQCKALLRRLLARVETLRTRLEAPLIVATFGGTGTGKSALVNALVGCECTASGRQRPTTTRPVLVAHPQTELSLLGLPLEDLEIVRVDAPAIRDVVLIDCPDPDTTETETQGSNLARLHGLLPHCDVLIYTSTQQKYRSARVADELAQAAAGCRLVFVQTCADLDADIRQDWQARLNGQYRVPEVFLVDSLRALREQQAGQRPTGDFRRLQELLSSELAASARTRIRRANLVDLVQSAVDQCLSQLRHNQPALDSLEEALARQEQRLTGQMTARLREELSSSSGLWERRLLGEVTRAWGLSPFSAVLKSYNGLGNLIASAGLWRARGSAQMALIGAVQAARWLTNKQAELSSEARLAKVATLGLDDALLRETQLVIAGYLQQARLDPALGHAGHFEALRHEAARVEDDFLGDAGRVIDQVIAELARRHSGLLVRVFYELLLGGMLVYVLGRPAYNFFYANPVLGSPLLPSDFYIHGGIFLAIWSGLLIMLFTRGLRRGLKQRIARLAAQLAERRLAAGLFPSLERVCAALRLECESLSALAGDTAALRLEIAASGGLGARTPAVGMASTQV